MRIRKLLRAVLGNCEWCKTFYMRTSMVLHAYGHGRFATFSRNGNAKPIRLLSRECWMAHRKQMR